MSRRWHVAHSLMVLLNEVNKRWPNRSKASDGTIGDAAHSSRTSDHNPNGRGSVNARDVTARGIDPMELVRAAIRHPSTNYVIFSRAIWSRSRGFVPRLYTGANPHTGHVHISILQTVKAENSNVPWGLLAAPGLPSTGAPGPSPTPAPPGGLTMSDIKTITEKLDRIENALLAKRRAGGKDHSVIEMIVADHVIQKPQSVALADLQARVREVQSRVGSNPDQRAFVAAIVEGIAPLIGESAQEAATADPNAIAEATVDRLLAKIATLS